MKIVIALGGNAILRRGERGTAGEQFEHVRTAVRRITGLIERGEKILITHGNGPQVGDILLKNEIASDILPRMPLDVCGAESQGMIGYMIQQSLENALRERGISRPVITCITQTLVDRGDEAFFDPQKPIGPYYTEADAKKHREDKGWHIQKTGIGKKQFRRVVPSPVPIDIIEHLSIKKLYNEGFIVIAAGGGGIPVFRSPTGVINGIEAVVDKDHAAECLATEIGAEILLILTDVPCAYRNYGMPSQKPLGKITVDQAKVMLAEGQFGEGSMKPKIQACVRFVESGGKLAVITSLENVERVVEDDAGTRVTA